MTTASWEYLLVWEFHVKPGSEPHFERIYGPQGEWANFFRQDPNYCGTDLVRDSNHPGRYVTLDYWTSRTAYADFLTRHADEYQKIDALCEEMTEKEAALGAYQRVA
jgi:quinol monooxygenase YgiN